jgi:hypothetical protein
MRRLAIAAIILALSTGLFVTALGSLRLPWSGGDFISNWGLKSRALHRTGSLASIVLVDPSNNFVRPNYPPLWPIVLTSASRLAGGGWDPLLLTPLWPVLSLLACLLAMRATRGGIEARLLAGAAVALLPYYRTPLYRGYAEALLLVFVLAALGERDRLGRSTAASVRFALFIALAAATKQEGLVLAAVCVLACAAARRLRLASLVAFSTALAVVPWALFVRFHAEPAWRADFSVAAFALGKLGPSAGLLLHEAVLPNAGWILGAAVLLGLAPMTRASRRTEILGVAAYLSILFASMAFTTSDPAWHLRWSWDRLVLVGVAVLIPVLAECVGESFEPATIPASPAAA